VSAFSSPSAELSRVGTRLFIGTEPACQVSTQLTRRSLFVEFTLPSGGSSRGLGEGNCGVSRESLVRLPAPKRRPHPDALASDLPSGEVKMCRFGFTSPPTPRRRKDAWKLLDRRQKLFLPPAGRFAAGRGEEKARSDGCCSIQSVLRRRGVEWRGLSERQGASRRCPAWKTREDTGGERLAAHVFTP